MNNHAWRLPKASAALTLSSHKHDIWWAPLYTWQVWSLTSSLTFDTESFCSISRKNRIGIQGLLLVGFERVKSKNIAVVAPSIIIGVQPTHGSYLLIKNPVSHVAVPGRPVSMCDYCAPFAWIIQSLAADGIVSCWWRTYWSTTSRGRRLGLKSVFLGFIGIYC